MAAPIETKVALPAAAVACATVLVSALYTLALAYGFEPTDEQNLAIVGVGAALQYIAFVVVGYYAPHTERPDLPGHD